MMEEERARERFSPEIRIPFLPPLVALVLGLVSGSSLVAALPFAAAALLLLAGLAVARRAHRGVLTLAVLLAALLLGVVSAPRASDRTRQEPVKDSAISRRVDSVFDWSTARFVRAIMLAETDVLDEADRVNYRRAGLTHLLAISGLNVAILAGLFWSAARLAAGPVAAADYAAAAATLAYVLGIGAPPSALRAGIMAFAVFVARGMKRPAGILNVLFGAAFVTLAFDPAALFDAGFQLSYAATLGLILWTRPIERLLPNRPRLLWKLVAASAAAQLPTVPIMMYSFGQFAPIAFLANIAVVPIFGLIMPLIVLAVCGVPGTAALTNLLHHAVTRIVAAFAEMPGASFLIARPPAPAVVALLALAALPILARGRTRLAAGAALALFAGLAAYDPGPGAGVYLARHGSAAGIVSVENGRASLLDRGLPLADWRRAVSDLAMSEIDTIATASKASLQADRIFGLARDLPARSWELPAAWREDAEVENAAARIGSAGGTIAWREVDRGATLVFGGEVIAFAPDADPHATFVVEPRERGTMVEWRNAR